VSYELEPYNSTELDTIDTEPDIIDADFTPVDNYDYDVIDVPFEPINDVNDDYNGYLQPDNNDTEPYNGYLAYADDDIQDTPFTFIEPDVDQYPVPYQQTQSYDMERYTSAYMNSEPETITADYQYVKRAELTDNEQQTYADWYAQQKTATDTSLATYQATNLAAYEQTTPQDAILAREHLQHQTQTAPNIPTNSPASTQTAYGSASTSVSVDGQGGSIPGYPFWFQRYKSPNESDEVWHLRHLWFQKHWDSGSAEFPEKEFHYWFRSLRPWERGMFAAAGKQIYEGEWRHGDRKKQDKIYAAIDNYYDRVNAARDKNPVGMFIASVRRFL